MLHQQTSVFDETQQALALALYDSGAGDTEIGLSVGTTPATITDWRTRRGLPLNVVETERYTGPVNRAMPAVKPQGNRPDRPEDWGMEPEFARAARGGRAPAHVPSIDGKNTCPPGDDAIEIGANPAGPIYLDLAELLTTRLLVQGNSGSGKSHLLRRIMEETAGLVQQAIIDPEGDFGPLGETFGHVYIDATLYTNSQLTGIAGRAREHRASIMLDLSQFKGPGEVEDEEDVEVQEKQMKAATAFLNGLFLAPRDHWHPALVFVDEAQLLAPSSNASLDTDKQVRRASVSAMADIMCRGRKRGLAGLLATQRLAKLSTNVAGEVSNFLMGRTFFDTDIIRAADLLGLKPIQAERIRMLDRGQFLGLGPAIARNPLEVTISDCITTSPNAPPELAPLPSTPTADLTTLVLPPEEETLTE